MKQITVLVPPEYAMHNKLDQKGTFQRAHDGGEESKEAITAEGRETQVEYRDKGYVTVVKPPQMPQL